MKLVAVVLVALMLVACQTVPEYGLSVMEYTKPDGTHLRISLGKEYGHFKASVTWDEDKPTVKVTALDVRAFQGQAIAAQVAIEIEREISARLQAGGDLTAEVLTSITRGAVTRALLMPPIPPEMMQ